MGINRAMNCQKNGKRQLQYRMVHVADKQNLGIAYSLQSEAKQETVNLNKGPMQVSGHQS